MKRIRSLFLLLVIFFMDSTVFADALPLYFKYSMGNDFTKTEFGFTYSADADNLGNYSQFGQVFPAAGSQTLVISGKSASISNGKPGQALRFWGIVETPLAFEIHMSITNMQRTDKTVDPALFLPSSLSLTNLKVGGNIRKIASDTISTTSTVEAETVDGLVFSESRLGYNEGERSSMKIGFVGNLDISVNDVTPILDLVDSQWLGTVKLEMRTM